MIFELCENFLIALDNLLTFTGPDDGDAPVETADLVKVHDPDFETK